MKNLKLLCILLVSMSVIESCGDNQKAKNFNNKTIVDGDALNFIQTATESGLVEIKASTLAEKTSTNQRVIALAKMIIADHLQAGKELSELAKDKLVNKTDILSAAYQKTIDSLAKLNNASFNKAYANMMVTDHIKAVKLFEGATNNRNNDIQQLAKKILPKLKMHLDSAQIIFASLK